MILHSSIHSQGWRERERAVVCSLSLSSFVPHLSSLPLPLSLSHLASTTFFLPSFSLFYFSAYLKSEIYAVAWTFFGPSNRMSKTGKMHGPGGHGSFIMSVLSLCLSSNPFLFLFPSLTDIVLLPCFSILTACCMIWTCPCVVFQSSRWTAPEAPSSSHQTGTARVGRGSHSSPETADGVASTTASR